MGPVLPRVESGDAFEARGRGPRCASERVRGRDAAAGGAPPTKAAGPAAAGPSRGWRRAGRPQISRLAAGAASRGSVAIACFHGSAVSHGSAADAHDAGTAVSHGSAAHAHDAGMDAGGSSTFWLVLII